LANSSARDITHNNGKTRIRTANLLVGLFLAVISSAATLCQPVLPAPATRTGASVLQSLLDKKQYLELDMALRQGTIAQEDAVFFRGVLANRKNQVQQSIQILLPMARKLTHSAPSVRERDVLLTLADDYAKLFEYSKAEAEFAALLRRHGRSLNRKQRVNVSDRLKEMRVLRSAPLQTLEQSASFTLPVTHNQLGLLEIPVGINGQTESWVLDTGANTCVITETTARRIGLPLLKGTATTRGVGGMPLSFHIGVVSEMKIGTAVLHNVELDVTSDKNLNLAGIQLQGIIGFPVQAALGNITFYANGKIGINTEPPGPMDSELFLENQTPLVAVHVEGSNLLFSLDTGAAVSTFDVQFYNVVKAKLRGEKRSLFTFSGTGGRRSSPAYNMSNLRLSLGGEETTLENASVFAGSTQASSGDFFGNLGQDALRSFTSYSVDFTRMKFTARK
jgi:hypothetical protein